MKYELPFCAQTGLQACQKQPGKISFQKLTVLLVFTGIICFPTKLNSQGTGVSPANTLWEIEQQSITLTGIITDSISGETISGVSIIDVNSGVGAVSDVNGKHNVNLTSQYGVLLFSHIGYIPKKVYYRYKSLIRETNKLEKCRWSYDTSDKL